MIPPAIESQEIDGAVTVVYPNAPEDSSFKEGGTKLSNVAYRVPESFWGEKRFAGKTSRDFKRVSEADGIFLSGQRRGIRGARFAFQGTYPKYRLSVQVYRMHKHRGRPKAAKTSKVYAKFAGKTLTT
jgi:hypothetical protein